MNSFISNLYDYISQCTLPIRDDPEYSQAFKEYLEMENKIKEKIGSVLLYEFEEAEARFYSKQNMAIFTNTLQFCLQFVLSVLD